MDTLLVYLCRFWYGYLEFSLEAFPGSVNSATLRGCPLVTGLTVPRLLAGPHGFACGIRLTPANLHPSEDPPILLRHPIVITNSR